MIMKWFEAYDIISSGGMVKREGWEMGTYIMLTEDLDNDEESCLINEKDEFITVELADLQADDWIEYDPQVRAKRRFDELQAKGSRDTFEKVLKEVNDRDHADMNRPVAPLKQTKSHILVDTSDMTIEQVIAHMSGIVREKCKL